MKPTSIRSRPTVFEIKEESIKEKSKEPRMKIVEELENGRLRNTVERKRENGKWRWRLGRKNRRNRRIGRCEIKEEIRSNRTDSIKWKSKKRGEIKMRKSRILYSCCFNLGIDWDGEIKVDREKDRKKERKEWQEERKRAAKEMRISEQDNEWSWQEMNILFGLAWRKKKQSW